MRFNNEEKIKYLEQWKQSGKSSYAFAKENGINTQTFLNWKKKEKRISPSFIEIPIKTIQQFQKPEILIIKGDVKIHIPLMIGSNELRSIMEVLGSSL